jgi:ribosome production factor 2
LEKRAPKLIENVKQALFVRGGHTNSTITDCLKNFFELKKPNGTFLKSKNPFHPFEDETALEKFAQKYDSSLFAFGSHSKKRPNNLILGRLYDYRIFDMFELCIENFKSINEFKKITAPVGIKPCLCFAGDGFQQDQTLKRLKNLFIDFFRGDNADKLRLQGLEMLISFTSIDKKIFMKTYKIVLKKSGTRVPRVELVEVGPSMEMTIRRQKMASDEFFKQACKQPKAVQVKKVKNITRDVFGTQMGRVHVKQQDISTLRTRKMRGLRQPRFDHRQEFQPNEPEIGSPRKKIRLS